MRIMWEYRFVTFAPVDHRKLRSMMNPELKSDGRTGGSAMRNETRMIWGNMKSSLELEPIDFGTRVRIQIVVCGMLGILWNRMKGEREGRRMVAQLRVAIEQARSDNSRAFHGKALVG